MRPNRRAWLPWAILIALGAALGVGLAISSSPGSLGRALPRAAVGTRVSPAPLSSPSTSPTVQPTAAPTRQLKPGQLIAPVSLQVVGDRLFAVAGGRSITSTDGTVWTALPSGVDGGPVVPDPGTGLRFLSGGTTVSVSVDGGRTWRASPAPPPPGGPYQPLVISPTEPGIWFVLHQGRLARTRDNGASWRDFGNLPPLGTAPAFASGSAKGQFFLGAQSEVFELSDNGQQIQDRGAIPGGATVAQLVHGAPGSPGVVLARTGAGALFALRDGTWTTVAAPLPGPISGAPGKVALVVDGGADLGQPGNVSVSIDAGQTWAAGTGLPTDQPVLAASAASDGQTAYAYCAGGDLFRSVDGGHSWTLLSSTLRTP